MRPDLPALALLSLVTGATAGAAKEPGLHSFTLDNGLTVVVVEDRRAPAVTQMLWYRVGSADEAPGQSGTAHFLEHLMFKATDKLAEGEFDRTVEENGGTFQAFTSTDHTAFVEHIASDRLDLVMGMEADRMVNLAPTEASVLSEREVVQEERKQEVEGDPGGAFYEQLLAALYPDSPEGRPTIGSEDEIGALTRDKAMAFYRAHYAPNNAVLVVAGDVGSDEVRQLAERHFAAIPSATLAARPDRPPEPPRPSVPRIEVHDARVPLPQITRLYLAPRRRAGDQADAAALVVLADLLGAPRATSIMARELMRHDGIALAAEASYSPTGIGQQEFGLYLVPVPGVAPADAEAALDALIARFIEQGPDPQEIERIRGRVRGNNVYMLDDVRGRASYIGEALASGLTLEDVEAWPAVLEQVTVEDVRRVARDVFRNQNSVTGWLMPPADLAEGPQN